MDTYDGLKNMVRDVRGVVPAAIASFKGIGAAIRASVNDPASLLALAGQLEGNPQDLANMIVTDPSTNAPYSDIGNFVASATYGPRPTAEENAAADKKAAADQKASGEKVAAEAKAPRK